MSLLAVLSSVIALVSVALYARAGVLGSATQRRVALLAVALSLVAMLAKPGFVTGFAAAWCGAVGIHALSTRIRDVGSDR